MKTITIRKPDDFHAHIRQGEMLRDVVPLHRGFGRVLVMPNLTPPILDADDVEQYRAEILAEQPTFEPLMTIKITAATTPEMVLSARAAGVVAGKLYPEGVTTNSADGVSDVRSLQTVFETMADCGMVLCVHGETPGVFILDREASFVHDPLPWIAETFPTLRIVVEHATTAEAIAFVRSAGANVAASITVHHLVISLDDVIGNMLEPHHFCKPVAKRPEDRDALVDAATSGESKFFLGTDSAPHARDKKECASGCAGVFTAPVAMSVLAETFEEHDALDKLEAFSSLNGAHFYGLQPNDEQLRLVRSPWEVPSTYADVVPFRAGHTLQWRVAED